VRQIAADGTTVLLTTQYLEEADRLAERMAVIDHGRVIAEGTSHELKASIGGNALRLQLASPEQRADALAIVDGLLADGSVLPNTDPTSISVKVADASVAAGVLSALSGANIALADFSLGTPSLDDVFFAVTGRPAETPEADAAAEAAS
jgi:ABC-2 type transport system ATP-binding protein